jgi:mono/diheme cytochrome c family protein
MLGAGMLPTGKPVSISPITAPPAGSTLLYGEYILSYQDCRACHGTKLTGGVPGQLGPIGPDLNLVKRWKLAEFIATMRTGVDPNGHELSKEMPWQPIGRMSDEELGAVYQYLTHLPIPDTPLAPSGRQAAAFDREDGAALSAPLTPATDVTTEMKNAIRS